MAFENTTNPTAWFAQTIQITTPGTAQQLPNLGITQQINIKSDINNNSAGIFVGVDKSVPDAIAVGTDYTLLRPGESMSLPVNNANLIWWNTATAGDYLTFYGS